MVVSTALVLPACPICRDDEAGTDYVITKCGHAFHSECMKTWDTMEQRQGRRSKCPCCNTYVQDDCYREDDYYGYDRRSSSKPVRLHSLTLRQVHFIEEGELSPEEEFKIVRTNLDSAKVLLNKESNKVQKLETDMADLLRDKLALEAKVTKLKTESKENKQKFDNLVTELKAERQKRPKGLAIQEKERFQKRIDDASSYIDKLKAERQEINNNLFALRVDNTNVRGVSDRQAGVIRQLYAQIGALVHEKNKLQSLVNSLNQQLQQGSNAQKNHSNIPISVLKKLNGEFQKMEEGYLAFKEMFARNLDDTQNLAPGLPNPNNPVPAEPVTPSLHNSVIPATTTPTSHTHPNSQDRGSLKKAKRVKQRTQVEKLTANRSDTSAGITRSTSANPIEKEDPITKKTLEANGKGCAATKTSSEKDQSISVAPNDVASENSAQTQDLDMRNDPTGKKTLEANGKERAATDTSSEKDQSTKVAPNDVSSEASVQTQDLDMREDPTAKKTLETNGTEREATDKAPNDVASEDSVQTQSDFDIHACFSPLQNKGKQREVVEPTMENDLEKILDGTMACEGFLLPEFVLTGTNMQGSLSPISMKDSMRAKMLHARDSDEGLGLFD